MSDEGQGKVRFSKSRLSHSLRVVGTHSGKQRVFRNARVRQVHDDLAFGG